MVLIEFPVKPKLPGPRRTDSWIAPHVHNASHLGNKKTEEAFQGGGGGVRRALRAF